MAARNFGASELESEPREQREWVRAHEALSRLAKVRAAADAEEGRWLLAALRSGAHVHLGFGSFAEYVERLFGYRPRSTQEKLRVAEALEGLPVIAQALEEGSLSWSCALELTRVAVAQTEREWLEVARGKTVHQLEALVAGKTPGNEPSAQSDYSARRRVLRFEVTQETLALFREAMNKLRRGSGTQLDDDSALLLMARHVLGGPSDEGQASYQTALSVCPECGRGGQQASGELVPVGAEVVAMAHCDGQHLGLLHPPVAVESATAVESAHTGAPSKPEASSRRPRAHTGPTRALAPSKPSRQRRAGRYFRRDHRRCTVPGCRNTLFLDLHHIELSSEGGHNHVDNLVALCGAHHSAAHRGELGVSGKASTGVRFDTPTAATTDTWPSRAWPRHRPRRSLPCVVSAFANEMSVEYSPSSRSAVRVESPTSKLSCGARFRDLAPHAPIGRGNDGLGAQVRCFIASLAQLARDDSSSSGFLVALRSENAPTRCAETSVRWTSRRASSGQDCQRSTFDSSWGRFWRASLLRAALMQLLQVLALASPA